ncbi:IDEAL domain-containing protein [Lentibacillus sp. N15]|uniref:IDEAL domain-containing protein n=1 Tax=Lentibacillus songyuanensis TaxID=3136161 RepID=UPI0031BAEB2F
MVTVKMLKPYYIKADEAHVRVILAYQYFTVSIQDQLYHFVPNEAKEIRINRNTQQVDNIEANFAFQKGKDIIHIPMTKLVSLPDFQTELKKITEPYMKSHEPINININENAAIIEGLEQQNIKRLIDIALDKRDEALFHTLVPLLVSK